eukprot:12938255-Ditylum_brightwellii.AAC.1
MVLMLSNIMSKRKRQHYSKSVRNINNDNDNKSKDDLLTFLMALSDLSLLYCGEPIPTKAIKC